jgi:hypothetical protein
MNKLLKNLVRPDRPDAAALRHLATADPTIPPAVMPRIGADRSVLSHRLNKVNVPESATLADGLMLDSPAWCQHAEKTKHVRLTLPACDLQSRPLVPPIRE